MTARDDRSGDGERPDDLEVLFLYGYPRSGTTLLGKTIAELDGVFFAGEVRYFWGRAIPYRRKCGCGQRAPSCPFWMEVVDRFREVTGLTPEVVAASQRAALTGMTGMRLVASRRVPGAAQPYASALAEWYRAIAHVSGARTIIDSSKWPADAAITGRLDGITTRVLHVLRDPRKVIWSRQRRLESRLLRLRLTVYDTAGWLAVNVALPALLRRGVGAWQRITLEGLVADPASELTAVTGMLGRPADLPMLDGHTVHLSPNHVTSGNNNRHQIGAVPLVDDDGWRTGIPRFQRPLIAPAVFAYRRLATRAGRV